MTSRNSLLSVDCWLTRHSRAVGPTLRPQVQRGLRSRLRPTNDKCGWMRPTWGKGGSGCINTGLSIPAARRSTSLCWLNATQQRRALSPRALGGENHPVPRVINTDEHVGHPPAIEQLKAEGALEENCRHRRSWRREPPILSINTDFSPFVDGSDTGSRVWSSGIACRQGAMSNLRRGYWWLFHPLCAFVGSKARLWLLHVE